MSKNTHFNRYPPFIHGEARSEADEFILHTRYPRFLARRTWDETFTGALPAKPVEGEIGQTENGAFCYKSDVGVWFQNFIFFDSKPADQAEFLDALLQACNRAAADGLMLDDETEILVQEWEDD